MLYSTVIDIFIVYSDILFSLYGIGFRGIAVDFDHPVNTLDNLMLRFNSGKVA